MFYFLTKMFLYLLYLLKGEAYTRETVRLVLREIAVCEEEEKRERLEKLKKEHQKLLTELEDK